MALTISALLLVYSYRDHAARHYDEHVSMHMDELLDASELKQDGTFDLKYAPSDPRYQDFDRPPTSGTPAIASWACPTL